MSEYYPTSSMTTFTLILTTPAPEREIVYVEHNSNSNTEPEEPSNGEG